MIRRPAVTLSTALLLVGAVPAVRAQTPAAPQAPSAGAQAPAASVQAPAASIPSPAASIPSPAANAPAAGPQAPTASAPDFARLEAEQSAANGKPGPRTVPGRRIPVPGTVSPEFQAAIAAPYRSPAWNANPDGVAEWKALVARLAAQAAASLPALRERLGVIATPEVIGGVKAWIIAPRDLPERNRNRLLVHIHGGGYVHNPGEAGTVEAVLMAAFGGFTVISFDYRMPPDAPFPAALDDAMAVWKAALTLQRPENMAVFGTSTGGAMTLALMLRAKQEGVALPAAIAPGTPWSDLTETGDSYKANEWLDNVLVSYEGTLTHVARLYAAGHDLKDPLLSPIYGDFRGLPPAILTTGTRDLFLSNTVRTHRKLRQAGVEASLQVFEGMSHAQYLFNPDAPETREVFGEIAAFFDRTLGTEPRGP
ncbi:Alpha/beta hydrolase fold-3 domain protein [Methylobacterium sp. 4-46]|uniref:alpha/beta hydrolase n=1 Tax=unclassified Methylobacterium TaxID=2615210 RepID=UPI000152D0B5|nr:MULTISPECIES: alpha/beta hydrolase [Methylobacterium]ACA15557.1 Alpha/beta hydrolase fold-3 domain protein [Methylobacterium sp. 4-46]WFT81270.1 alpha/beta hydrolase fold domain-containing protein [Methylobacterium nodulans]